MSSVFQASKICDNVSVIKAKYLTFWGVWLFVALAVRDKIETPRLIIPHFHIDAKSCTHRDKEVTLIFKALVDVVISVEFRNSSKARTFFDFVEFPPRPN